MRKNIVVVFATLVALFPNFALAAGVGLSWTDVLNEDSYKIERAVVATGPFAEIKVTGPNVTAHSDLNLVEGVTYFYKLRACNAAGCSPYAETNVRVPVTTVPNTPTNFRAVPLP